MIYLDGDFDYQKTLKDNCAAVLWDDSAYDGDGNEYPLPAGIAGYSLSWPKGCLWLGPLSLEAAERQAALFIELYLRGVSASFAYHLMRNHYAS